MLTDACYAMRRSPCCDPDGGRGSQRVLHWRSEVCYIGECVGRGGARVLYRRRRSSSPSCTTQFRVARPGESDGHESPRVDCLLDHVFDVVARRAESQWVVVVLRRLSVGKDQMNMTAKRLGSRRLRRARLASQARIMYGSSQASCQADHKAERFSLVVGGRERGGGRMTGAIFGPPTAVICGHSLPASTSACKARPMPSSEAWSRTSSVCYRELGSPFDFDDRLLRPSTSRRP
jgi:hypothetical protein